MRGEGEARRAGRQEGGAGEAGGARLPRRPGGCDGARCYAAWAMADRKQDAEAGRERFVETAYWNPSVVTGADGKATVRVKAPGAMSEYRFTARGVTGADTLVGQTTAGLVVRKDFFVDLKAPAALTQGDRPRFIGQVHHVGVAGDVVAHADGLRGRPAGRLPEDADAQGRRRRRGRLRPGRGPRRRQRPPDAQGPGRRAVRRADDRGPDPPLGRAGVRVGLGHVERRRDRLRRPAAGADVREPRHARDDRAEPPADDRRAGPGRDRAAPAGAVRPRTSSVPARSCR